MFVHYVNWLDGIKIIWDNYAKSNDRNGNAEKLLEL